MQARESIQQSNPFIAQHNANNNSDNQIPYHDEVEFNDEPNHIDFCKISILPYKRIKQIQDDFASEGIIVELLIYGPVLYNMNPNGSNDIASKALLIERGLYLVTDFSNGPGIFHELSKNELRLFAKYAQENLTFYDHEYEMFHSEKIFTAYQERYVSSHDALNETYFNYETKEHLYFPEEINEQYKSMGVNNVEAYLCDKFLYVLMRRPFNINDVNVRVNLLLFKCYDEPIYVGSINEMTGNKHVIGTLKVNYIGVAHGTRCKATFTLRKEGTYETLLARLNHFEHDRSNVKRNTSKNY